MKKEIIFYIVMLISLVVAFVSLAHKVCMSGNSEDDHKIVCVGGHEYYRTNFLYKSTLAIRIDDNGKPIQCK